MGQRLVAEYWPVVRLEAAKGARLVDVVAGADQLEEGAHWADQRGWMVVEALTGAERRRKVARWGAMVVCWLGGHFVVVQLAASRRLRGIGLMGQRVVVGRRLAVRLVVATNARSADLEIRVGRRVEWGIRSVQLDVEVFLTRIHDSGDSDECI
ncbi:MAG: hypothetical protein LBL92_00100 [Propionibacteriaceae bacterium]|jgi:hypothetical protein|nr:hypothetical protein [Propionibacteriaceae bacterium]